MPWSKVLRRRPPAVKGHRAQHHETEVSRWLLHAAVGRNDPGSSSAIRIITAAQFEQLDVGASRSARVNHIERLAGWSFGRSHGAIPHDNAVGHALVFGRVREPALEGRALWSGVTAAGRESTDGVKDVVAVHQDSGRP